MTATELIAAQIRREGSITFDAFMDVALYDSEHGFFAQRARRRSAGRDFVTAPEIGPLFGALRRATDRPHCGDRSARRTRSSSSRRAPATVVSLARSARRAGLPALRCGTCSSSGRPSCARSSASSCRSNRPTRRSVRSPCARATRKLAPVHAAGPVFASVAGPPGDAGRLRRVRQRAARQPAVRHRRVGRRPLERGARRARRFGTSSSCWSRWPTPMSSMLTAIESDHARGPGRRARADPAGHRSVAHRVQPLAAHGRRRRSSTTSSTSPTSFSARSRMVAYVPRPGAAGNPLDAPGSAGHHRRRRPRADSRTRRPRPGSRSPATESQADWLRRTRHRRARRRRSTRRGRTAPPAATSTRSPVAAAYTKAAALTDPTGLGAHRVVTFGQTTVQPSSSVSSLGRAARLDAKGTRMAERARGTAPGGAHLPAARDVPAGRTRHRRVRLRRRPSATGRASGPRRRSRSTGSTSGTRSSSGTCRSRSGSSAAG